ncbi:hypothetical protein [Paraburkholderia sacchari]|uniref:hypothetical protein n=1 Tax=Paraburkholderia sacchari TaxID=159450 RepID=UPI0039A5357B
MSQQERKSQQIETELKVFFSEGCNENGPRSRRTSAVVTRAGMPDWQKKQR